MTREPPPALSVIVPVRNEKQFLRSCLDSILADAPAGGIEVIVVDGESDDGTWEEARDASGDDARIRVIRNPTRFVPRAMNLGIEAASAQFIGRIDGHCRVEPGYFPGCLARLQTGGYDCVGGVTEAEGRTPTGRAIAAASSSPVGVGGARFRTGRGGEALVDTLAFGVYRRDVFARIGPFDEALVRNQDDELNFRLTRAGGRILLVPSLRVRYVHRDSLRQLGRQYYQYGYWKWKVFRKHGRFASWRHLAPSCFLLGLIAGLLAWPLAPAGALAPAALLGPYLAVILAESLRVRLRGQAAWLRTALALMTLHVSYGTGMLRAAVDSALAGPSRRGQPGPTQLSR